MSDGLMAGQPDGRLRLSGMIAIVLCLAAGPFGRPAVGQVGHEPGSSPYRDVPAHPGPVLFVGHLGGDRGNAGSGMSNARTFGLRYELPAGHSVIFQFTGAYLQGDRFVLNPYVDSSSSQRKTGPFTSDLALGEIGMQLRLSGGKSWRGLAPYVGTALGLIFDVKEPKDTSAYRFGTKLTPAFATGVRWYASRHLQMNVDLRIQAWRLKYPVAYHLAAPDGSRILPLDRTLQDWTMHPWISAGVGWIF